MGKEKRRNKASDENRKPISREGIYQIMFWVTTIATIVFLIKNIILHSILGITVIGICLAFFMGSTLWMKAKNVDHLTRETVLSVMLVLVVFIISINSGDYYSDDFPMYLAVLALTGLYLEPKLTVIQLILEEFAFIFMYIIHPEKGGDLTQYILCQAIFTLAGVLFWRSVKRGRDFITVSERQAEQSEKLLNSIKEMGDIIQKDFDESSERIDESTKGLTNGSSSITRGTDDVAYDCNLVQDTIMVSEKYISELNDKVMGFEKALANNQKNIDVLKEQLDSVKNKIGRSNEIFEAMKTGMDEVTVITNRLSDISVKTTVLSLNAAVEAGNVSGSAGVGFEVVASEMKELAENSDKFVDMVAESMSQLMENVDKTSQQFIESTKELNQTEVAMNDMQTGFERLTTQFEQLYENIEEQGKNVKQVNTVFRDLRAKVTEMRSFSMQNQSAVENIVDAMNEYKYNVNRVVNNTRGLTIANDTSTK